MTGAEKEVPDARGPGPEIREMSVKDHPGANLQKNEPAVHAAKIRKNPTKKIRMKLAIKMNFFVRYSKEIFVININ